MKLKNTTTHYGALSKLLHWTMAGLFIAMFMIAYLMINIPKSAFRSSLFDLHKATGMLLLTLFVLRITWRLLNTQPTLSRTLPAWQIHVAKGSIVILYLLMLIMPVTGFLISSLGGHDISIYHLWTIAPLAHNTVASDFFSNCHEIISYFIIGIFTLHLLGTGYHHFILKDNVFKRMWIGRKENVNG